MDEHSRHPAAPSCEPPDTVGLEPFVTCRYSGRYVTAPNNAKPTMKPIALVTENVWLRKSESGKIGSAARASTSTNNGISTTLATINAMIRGDPHAQVVPPRLVKSTTDASAPASSAAPR